MAELIIIEEDSQKFCYFNQCNPVVNNRLSKKRLSLFPDDDVEFITIDFGEKCHRHGVRL